MKSRTPPPNLRRQVVRAAQQANVPLDEWDRAQVLSQIAGLIAAHPKVGGMIAFKGGAVMHLIDNSPRLSRDLDASLVAGDRVTEAVIREALGTRDAKRVVMKVGELVSYGPHSITFLVECHPPSGQGRVALQLSINWQAPLLRKPERKEVTIHGRKVSFLVVARVERIAEKVRAFLVRDRPGDAFDLYHFAKQGISVEDRADLPGLVATKVQEDDEVPTGVDLHDLFDKKVAALSKSWSKAALVLAGERPGWTEVGRESRGSGGPSDVSALRAEALARTTRGAARYLRRS